MNNQVQAREPTFSLENLQAIIDKAVQEALQAKDLKAKADAQAQIDKQVIQAFRRRGIENVKPRVDVKTYGLWEREGRKVRPGEKSVHVKQFRLFHISQTDAIEAEAPAPAQKAPVKARKASKAQPLPVGSSPHHAIRQAGQRCPASFITPIRIQNAMQHFPARKASRWTNPRPHRDEMPGQDCCRHGKPSR
jgi:hypothetical protein